MLWQMGMVRNLGAKVLHMGRQRRQDLKSG